MGISLPRLGAPSTATGGVFEGRWEEDGGYLTTSPEVPPTVKGCAFKCSVVGGAGIMVAEPALAWLTVSTRERVRKLGGQ